MARTDEERMQFLSGRDPGTFLRAAIDAAMDALRVDYRPQPDLDDVLTQIRNLRDETRLNFATERSNIRAAQGVIQTIAAVQNQILEMLTAGRNIPDTLNQIIVLLNQILSAINVLKPIGSIRLNLAGATHTMQPIPTNPGP